MWLLLLFILIPLLEIWLFILLGGFIGVYPTLLIILLTAVLGTFLVKTQGINEGDLVAFRPDTEYEFLIDGEKLYRMYDHQITLSL